MVGLLGRGGMGEVYRADDLKLGTPVAVKFLPSHVEGDASALSRFHDEVRVARQVSHPFVCRVFDIGEVDGRHFLSMEFVDGEDLATLLRRIGRLPPLKALELSRQLCAGLAAAHQQGVLHRDLKPANIMVDGHGRVRLTDFGLAVVGSASTHEFVGTPAYMAPEQLAGGAASVQSDLYALGLVLYEMFTGRRAFEAATIDEWRRAHTESPPISPSSHTNDMDPVVERAILRCLEKDPAIRPRSATEVALSLPGGDPVAVAVAEGETPSPAMVAAAGGRGALSPRLARGLLLATLALLAAIVAVKPYSSDFGLAPMAKSPDVLRDRAQEVVAQLGYGTPPRDETSWMERDYDLLRWMADNLPSVDGRRRLRDLGAPVLLTYRRADVGLRSMHFSGMVLSTVPPVINGSGDVQVVVDGLGRVRRFAAAPPAWREAAAERTNADLVFPLAGLDATRFSEIEARFTPSVPFDGRREWLGTRSDLPEMPLHLSVAWLDGRIVSVDVLGPWRRSATPVEQTGASVSVRQVVFVVFVMGVLGGMVELARRNLLAGRGDRRGALKVALALTLLQCGFGFLTTHFSRGEIEGLFGLVFGTVDGAVLTGLQAWLGYVAVEPYARRHVPNLLIGWARLLEGRVSDPAVGRDVLKGLVAGLGLAFVSHVANGLPTLINVPTQTPVPNFMTPYLLVGVVRLAPLAALVGGLGAALIACIWSFAMVTALRALARPSVATGVGVVLLSLLNLGGENPMIEVPVAIIAGATMGVVANHWGLLSLYALMVASLSGTLLDIGTTTWYAVYSWLVLLALVATAIKTFRTALAR